MNISIITEEQRQRRAFWVSEISNLSGNFGADSYRLEQEISAELGRDGWQALNGHLRLCGAIPEAYGHDGSEEKLYSKYTDVLLSATFAAMGLTSLVLHERVDAADVECVAEKYSFVADAKAFRLSRTAKNQKDFKVEAMHGWKRGKPYATVVCPIYQLPSRASQIYQQAIARSVCILSYTHLRVLLSYSNTISSGRAVDLLHEVFKALESLNPTKDSVTYWRAINGTMLDADKAIGPLWIQEKKAAVESIFLAKEEALAHLAAERERIMRLSREEAISEVIAEHKLDNRARTIQSVSYNGLLEMT